VKGIGFSFTRSPFFLSAQAPMNASAWSLAEGGDLLVRDGDNVTPGYRPTRGNISRNSFAR
jgi:hypothetical protein